MKIIELGIPIEL